MDWGVGFNKKKAKKMGLNQGGLVQALKHAFEGGVRGDRHAHGHIMQRACQRGLRPLNMVIIRVFIKTRDVYYT